MLQLMPLIGLNNQKELIAKHIADFSKALLSQPQNQGSTVNIHANMETFNKTIHEVAAQ